MPTINGKACVANGINLIAQSDLKGGYLNRDNGNMMPWGSTDFRSDIYIPTNGATVFTFSSPDYVFKGDRFHTLAMYDSDKKYLGWQSITSATQTLSKPSVAYIRFSINFKNEGGTANKGTDWLSAHRYKLEKGSVATPLTPAPVDKVFSNGRQVYGKNLLAGTSNVLKTVTNATDWSSNLPSYGVAEALKENQTYIVSCYLEPDKHDVCVYMHTANGNIGGTTVTAGSKGVSTLTITFSPEDEAFKADRCWISFTSPQSDTSAVSYKGYKLEKGTIATPWTPAPEDVM